MLAIISMSLLFRTQREEFDFARISLAIKETPKIISSKDDISLSYASIFKIFADDSVQHSKHEL